MSITSASDIGNRAVSNSQQPIQSPRSICSVAKAIASWVYEHLVAFWNRVSCWWRGAPLPNANVVVLQPSGPQTAQTELISRTSGSFANALAPHTAEHQWANSTVDRAMAAIKAKLAKETNFPNKTLIAIRIEGKNAQPFLGAMNMNLTQVPKRFAWHATLHERMRDYLIKNQITKCEIGFCVGTENGRGLYDIKICETRIAVENSGATSSSGDMYCAGISFEGIKCLFETQYTIFHVIADRVEDIFKEDAVPKVW